MLKRVVKIIAVVRSSAIAKRAANNKDKMFSAEPQTQEIQIHITMII